MGQLLQKQYGLMCMGLTVSVIEAVTEAIGFNPSRATFPIVDATLASQKLLEYKTERLNLSLTAKTFDSSGDPAKLKVLLVGNNLLKKQTDTSALEILEKHLPAHVALSTMLDSMITQAVRADKTIMRGAFRLFMASLAEEYKDSHSIKIANAAGDLVWGLNFALRGQAGLIATLIRSSEPFPIEQRAEFCAIIIEKMQQRNLCGFNQ